jgi:hypothetical protein
METVGFVHMADGTAEDYALLDRVQAPYNAAVADRLLVAFDALNESLAGYQVTRYEHSLQSATRALRDGRSEEYVVAALLHDIGDELAPWTHGEMTAAIMKPFIAPDICWIVKHHGLFQMYYYAHYSGGDRNARDRFKDHPLLRRHRRVLRALRPELFRPGVRLAATRDVRADGAARVLGAAPSRRLGASVSAAGG